MQPPSPADPRGKRGTGGPPQGSRCSALRSARGCHCSLRQLPPVPTSPRNLPPGFPPPQHPLYTPPAPGAAPRRPAAHSQQGAPAGQDPGWCDSACGGGWRLPTNHKPSPLSRLGRLSLALSLNAPPPCPGQARFQKVSLWGYPGRQGQEVEKARGWPSYPEEFSRMLEISYIYAVQYSSYLALKMLKMYN